MSLYINIIVLIPVVGGTIYSILCMIAALRYKKQIEKLTKTYGDQFPPVTIFKPVYGLEKNLKKNLRTACLQDYPKYQVIYSVQRSNDPAISILYDIQNEFGSEKVTVVVENVQAGPNGKINNLIGAYPYAKYDYLVISDSDIYLESDYLKKMIPPLLNPEIGYVCSLFKAVYAQRWYEKLELMSFNADFVPNLIFAELTGASDFCVGGSLAYRRETLKEIGGFQALSEYLVEDYEFGRRVRSTGKKLYLIPYVIETMVNLKNMQQWWDHQIYWDQNIRLARPKGFFFTILIRSIPFAVLFFILNFSSMLGLLVLCGAVMVRMVSCYFIQSKVLKDKEGVQDILWLPFRDIAGLASWYMSFTGRRVVWRDIEYTLTREGKLVPRKSS